MTRFSFLLIVIACIGISVCIAFAEDTSVNGATIRGEVTEAIGKQNPIGGATVKIISSDGKERTVKTDAKGKYEYKGLPAGRYTIKIYKRGYGTRVSGPKVVTTGGELYYPAKMVNEIKRLKWLVEAFLEHVCADIGTRYSLDRKVVVALYQSIQESIENVFKLDGSVPTYPRATDGYIALHEALLSHPDTKSAFAKHLTETQLQDYIDFTKARRQRYQQAIVRIMTAFMDQAFSLTPNQRGEITQSLFQITKDRHLSLMNILSQPFQEVVVNLLHEKPTVSLNKILTKKQLEIWEGWKNLEENKPTLADLARAVGKEMERSTPKLDQGFNTNLDEPHDEAQENIHKSQPWQLAEAVLTAHIEEFGPLNEHANQRLALVFKGVIPQFIDNQKEYANTKTLVLETLSDLMVSVNNDTITRENAVKKLNVMRQAYWGTKNINKQNKKNTEPSMVDNLILQYITKSVFFARIFEIINHPLYQQTIKDVLSEEMYAQYNKRQTEREIFRQQVSRNVVVALFDRFLLLNDAQLKHFENTVAKLTLPTMNNVGLVYMFLECFLNIDPNMLSLWQRNAFATGGMQE
ncbi:hypothetical protein C6501_19580 [Candidatus Poribacteria bacterium]|nr:MAG: hypothetical protein C6501_19580 [Candidatus Poribacteria bacterium]